MKDILLESMSPYIKRRIPNDMVKDDIDTVMDYEFDINSFESSSDCVEEICDAVVYRIMEDVADEKRYRATAKEKDELYFYLVRNYGKYITKRYNESKQMNESGKNYIVTESQLNLILESQKHIQFFQDLIDSGMDYIRRVCDDSTEDYSQGDVHDESCNQIAELEKVKVIDADWVTVKHSNREQEEKFMRVKIMVYYSSIRRGDFDADDLAYDLERMIRKSTGMPFILNYESTNTNTDWEW